MCSQAVQVAKQIFSKQIWVAIDRFDLTIYIYINNNNDSNKRDNNNDNGNNNNNDNHNKNSNNNDNNITKKNHSNIYIYPIVINQTVSN